VLRDYSLFNNFLRETFRLTMPPAVALLNYCTIWEAVTILNSLAGRYGNSAERT